MKGKESKVRLLSVLHRNRKKWLENKNPESFVSISNKTQETEKRLLRGKVELEELRIYASFFSQHGDVIDEVKVEDEVSRHQLSWDLILSPCYKIGIKNFTLKGPHSRLKSQYLTKCCKCWTRALIYTHSSLRLLFSSHSNDHSVSERNHKIVHFGLFFDFFVQIEKRESEMRTRTRHTSIKNFFKSSPVLF